MDMFRFVNEQVALCPHCGVSVRFEKGCWLTAGYSQSATSISTLRSLTDRGEQLVLLSLAFCPVCHGFVCEIFTGKETRLAYPFRAFRPVLHPAVPDDLRQDREEAALILSLSPQASAALSRRCLQQLLTKQGANPKKRLKDQIDEMIAQNRFPSRLNDLIHTVRELGNMAAHPKEDHATGEILRVQDGEAEYLLDLLDELFDEFYAKPAVLKARKDAIQQRIKVGGSAGSVPVQGPAPNTTGLPSGPILGLGPS